MHVGDLAQQQSIHTKVWIPAFGWMERDRSPGGLKRFDDFFWADLIRRGETGLTRENIYTQFGRKFPSDGNAQVTALEVDRLASLSKPYQWIEDPSTYPGTSTAVKRAQQNMRDLDIWGAQPAKPLLLELADMRAQKELTDSQFGECLSYVRVVLHKASSMRRTHS